MADTNLMEKLVALCKRRGFIYQSSEIYGGIGGFWDYGPLGVELKRNIKEAWWRDMVTNPPAGPDGREITMVGLDCSIIMNPKVWEASGHATGFADPMVECSACRKRYRGDKVYFLEICDETGSLMFSSPLLAEEAPQTAGIPVAEADDKAEAEAYFNFLMIRFKKRGGVHQDFIQRYEHGEYRILTALEGKGRKLYCPQKGCLGELSGPRSFNLMFKTHYGALEDSSSLTYLRPETAQGIFANFKNVLDTSRVKLPFGVAQVGKAFRNEINPRNYTFRSREFEQMEIEFFCRGAAEATEPRSHEAPKGSAGVSPAITDLDWYQFWRRTRYEWYVKLGLGSDKLRLRDQGKEELAHYSSACADIEYLFPFSDEFQELEGVAHRGCYDLTQHQTHSGKDMSYFDDEAWQAFLAKRKADAVRDGETERRRDEAKGETPNPKPETRNPKKEQQQELKNKPPFKFIPTVIEPSAGADRSALAFLCEAYTEDQAPDEKGVMQTRVVMKFHPRLAPIKAAFFPLVNRENMPDVAYALYREAKKHFNVQYDDGGAIGRRYRRQDEAGTPFCITVDGKTVAIDSSDPDAGTVTIRDRDTLAQVRVPREGVCRWLKQTLGSAVE